MSSLGYPSGIFVGSNNEVYIADAANHRIRKILQNGKIVTIAGSGIAGYGGDDGPAINAELHYPNGVFVSPRNEVYIADFNNHRIRKILQNGNIVTIAGTGSCGYSGDNGPAINAQLGSPCAIYVSSQDEVYIADFNNHRIRKILQNGNIVTIAGTGIAGYNGDKGPAVNAQLNHPTEVFVSLNNEVYISDNANHRIRKILRDGSITTIAGNGIAGFSGDYGPETDTQLNSPAGVFVSSQNEVFIADHVNHRIVKILINENIITIAGTGIAGYRGDNGPATDSRLNYPHSVFVSFENEVYISDHDNHSIRKILQDGNIVTIAGDGTQGYSGDVPFDIRIYPHIGYPIKVPFLKKHSRNQLFDLLFIFEEI